MNQTFEMNDSDKSRYQINIKDSSVASNHLLEHKPEAENDDMNNAMKSVFHIIHENAVKAPDDNNNNIFKKYLCEILNGEHPYNIFNTYLYIEKSIPFVTYKYHIPFFVILSLKKNAYFDINDIYLTELKSQTNEKDRLKNEDDRLYETEIKKIYHIFNYIFNNPDKPLYNGYDYTNMDIINIILSNHLIHLDIIDVYKYKNAIVEYDPSNTPLPWAIYCKNQTFLDLFNKMNNFALPSETASVDPETASVDPETASVELETFVVPGTIVNEKAKQNTEKFEEAIRQGEISRHTIHTRRRTRGYRRNKGRHRYGGKYTKRMPNKGKSPVRQTKRIKLKRKTHKRRST